MSTRLEILLRWTTARETLVAKSSAFAIRYPLAPQPTHRAHRAANGMTPTEEIDLMRAVILVVNFRGDDFHGVCAALLYRALAGGDFTAACLPGDITKGDIHVSGLAVKMLQKCGLFVCVGLMPSPNKNAKGRLCRVWRMAPSMTSTARTWLARHAYPATLAEQQSLMAI